MRRREFIGMASAACVLVSPFAARAQRAAPALVGFLAAGSKEGSFALVDDLKRGLTENGMLEGKDYILKSYWAEGDYNRFPSFARELVAKQAQVIIGNTISAVQAAQRATTVIPIVMMGINDPVGTGIVTSLARPGGNITGMATLNQDGATKLLQYLRGLLPKADRCHGHTQPRKSIRIWQCCRSFKTNPAPSEFRCSPSTSARLPRWMPRSQPCSRASRMRSSSSRMPPPAVSANRLPPRGLSIASPSSPRMLR